MARLTPTAVVAASPVKKHSQFVQKLFSTKHFRVYSSDDIIGCEIGGSLKNVIAIAAGITDGLKLGDNTKAALITRGLAQMSTLGQALGANPLTFSGLSGLGDLMVTCASKHSRNRAVGEQIGMGRKLEHILNEMQMVAEGVESTKSIHALSQEKNIELPIPDKVFEVLFEHLDPLLAIEALMTREYRNEL